jgi:WD40 repeat protein
VVGGQTGTLTVRDAEGAFLSSELTAHRGAVRALALEGHRLFSAGDDKKIRVYDTRTWSLLQVLGGHTTPVVALAPLRGGRLLSGARDKPMRLWDLATGKAQSLLAMTPARSIALVASKRRGVVASFKGSLGVWEDGKARSGWSSMGGDSAMRQVALNREGDTLLGVSEAGLQRRWWTERPHVILGSFVYWHLHEGLTCLAAGAERRVVCGDQRGRVWFVTIPDFSRPGSR